MAICGSNTTAALECYLNNIKLVVLKESDTPIMTPVYELPGVEFISTSSSLKRIISLGNVRKIEKRKIGDVFRIDESLKAWLEFLNQ